MTKPILGIGRPADYSTHGHLIDGLFDRATLVIGGYFALVVLALCGFLILYRARPGRRAHYTHGDGLFPLASTVALALSVFVLIDLHMVGRAFADLRDLIWKQPTGPRVLRVEIMPQQWAWNIRYPGADGRFGTDDDVVTLSRLVVPVHTKVAIQLRAKDVIHSLYLPHFRVKQDAIPGRITRTWFEATRTGRFEIACAQMCGWAHYKMRGELRVVTQEEFDAWYKDSIEVARAGYQRADKEAHWAWEWMP